MIKGKNGKYTFVDADPGKYLVEQGKEGPKMVRGIFISEEDIPEYEEKPIEK